jgi:hypothetical protein
VLPAEKEFGSSAPFFSVFHSLSKSGRSSANGGSEDRWVVMIQGIQKLMAEEPNVISPTKRQVNRICDSRIFWRAMRTDCFLTKFLDERESFCRIIYLAGSESQSTEIPIQDTQSANRRPLPVVAGTTTTA